MSGMSSKCYVNFASTNGYRKILGSDANKRDKYRGVLSAHIAANECIAKYGICILSLFLEIPKILDCPLRRIIYKYQRGERARGFRA